MENGKEQFTFIKKEMGITHKEFYAGRPELLNDIPYHHDKDSIKFQLKHKNIEIILGPEGVCEFSQ